MSKTNLTAWNRVELARRSDRPKSLDYINLIFSNFIEFGERVQSVIKIPIRFH